MGYYVECPHCGSEYDLDLTPEINSFPDFHCSDEEALEDIIACAEREKERLSDYIEGEK